MARRILGIADNNAFSAYTDAFVTERVRVILGIVGGSDNEPDPLAFGCTRLYGGAFNKRL